MPTAIGARATRQDLIFQQGATFRETFGVEDDAGDALDLTDATIRLLIYDRVSEDLLSTLTSAVEEDILLSEEDGEWLVTVSKSFISSMTDPGYYTMWIDYADGTTDKPFSGMIDLEKEDHVCG